MVAIKQVVGNSFLIGSNSVIGGEYVTLEGEMFYKISNYDQMRPFFISLVSQSDHWLFVSSTGGLSAGRKNEQSALFPYYTDDKISENAEHTGSKTILRVHRQDSIFLWEPFSERYSGLYSVRKNIYKSASGNAIIFEEINDNLALIFKYSWKFSEKFGFVRESSVINLNDDRLTVQLLDGLQNIVPYGVTGGLQNERSNLTNAYKKNELDLDSGLGLFLLSSMIVDKAEPSEALKATSVWSVGVKPSHYLLSSTQLDNFRHGESITTEVDVKAERGGYFVAADLELKPNGQTCWNIVAEINQDHSKVVDLIERLTSSKEELLNELRTDIVQGTKELRKLVGKADGLQLTADELSTGRHYSNVLFNIMRGGIFEDQYCIDTKDIQEYTQMVNKNLYQSNPNFFSTLASDITCSELIKKAESTKNPDLIRICYEYLPLSFSRRHGDPSRPWNKFSIETKRADGSKNRYYEGNWRDIFQNWEALALSFPGFIESMITKFANASTIDGYNPYRVTSEGIDWEVIEPDDPWSYIGYWGDHQIIYLLKLLELSCNHDPMRLSSLLAKPYFVYANVPYKIKSYEEILSNPQDTIDFDEEQEQLIRERIEKFGSDGKLVFDSDDQPCRANLTEKLLVMLLAKLSNFVPEAGIWLNTQRPEWNDANNALVGNGTSMVTVYYMRRFVAFCIDLFKKSEVEDYDINTPVAELFWGIARSLTDYNHLLDKAFSDKERREIVDELGVLGEVYRKKAYGSFDNSRTSIRPGEILDLLNLSIKFIDHSIKLSKREDGLYHAYNLIQINENEVSISHLYEMLEGQVAVLSSGLLTAKESLDVLDALKNSKMYRADQYSYLLYPDRDLPRFLDKNKIPKSFIEKSPLAKALLDANDNSLIVRDVKGEFHFSGDFNNANSLREILDSLKAGKNSDLVVKEYDQYLEVFETMFNHRAFTGRSGTFFGYEGLGSIYWHMVSKLLLATQEVIYSIEEEEESDKEVIGRLTDHYYEIRAGIGINKSPELYGAFPTDPYSHTPGNKGAQQPGMTGQVKEDIINRWAELGVRVNEGQIAFKPLFLHENEFLNAEKAFKFFDINGEEKELTLVPGELAFTYCQVPIIYQQSSKNSIMIEIDRDEVVFEGLLVDVDISQSIFERNGRVTKIIVELAL